MRMAQRCRKAWLRLFGSRTREVRASVSIGIALSTPDAHASEDVLKDADVAMRRAKAMADRAAKYSMKPCTRVRLGV